MALHLKSTVNAISSRKVAAIEIDWMAPICNAPSVQAPLRKSGIGTERARGKMNSWKDTCRMPLTAKLVSSMAAPPALRTGRKAILSIRTATTMPTAAVTSMPSQNGIRNSVTNHRP